MDTAYFLISLLNGLSVGLLLFMLASGLTLIFSMMGVLNFAHASFYMLGAYIAYTITQVMGFWWGLLLAPPLVGVLGAAFERFALRRVHKFGHVPELLITFGLSYIILELVQSGLGPAGAELPAAGVAAGAAVHDRRPARRRSAWPGARRRSCARRPPRRRARSFRPSAPSAWWSRC